MEKERIKDIRELTERMRSSADSIRNFDLDREASSQTPMLSDAIFNLRQGANVIDELLKEVERFRNKPRYV